MKSRFSATLLAAALLAGCQIAPLTGANPGTNATSKDNKAPIVDPKTGKALPNQPVEPLNGVEFKPLTQGSAQYLSNNGAAQNGTVATGAAPAAAPAMDAAEGSSISKNAAGLIAGNGGGAMPMPAPMASSRGGGGQFSGNVYSNYGYGYYFGGYGGGQGFEQMALVSAQEATTKGSTGSFQQIIADVAAPVVSAWAGDARLTESSAMLDAEGKLFVEPTTSADAMMKGGVYYPGGPYGYGENQGWRLVYVSSERQEMLTFAVKGDKTTIVRLRWAALDLSPARVTVDSASALKALAAAVADKGFQGEEEKTGKDYFMGYAFDQPKTGEWDGDTTQTEVLYAIPQGARWNVSLQQVMGKLVWDMNWWAPSPEDLARMNGNVGIAVPMPAVAMASTPPPSKEEMFDANGNPKNPCPSPIKETNTWYNYNGNGMIDAETGTVIRFSRPTKVTNTYEYQPYPCYETGYPTPMPSYRPVPAPSASPTPTPAPPDVANNQAG